MPNYTATSTANAGTIASTYELEFAPREVLPGRTYAYWWNADRVFRGRMLMVDLDCAAHFEITQLRIGKDVQLECTPAANFVTADEGLSAGNVILDTMVPGIQLGMIVTNKSDMPHVFSGKLRGIQVSPDPASPQHNERASSGPALIAATPGKPRIKFLGPVVVKGRERVELRVKIGETDAPFTVERLTVPNNLDNQSFVVELLQVNGTDVYGDAYPTPASKWSEDGLGLEVPGAPIALRYRDELVLAVRNSADVERTFVATLNGHWEEWESSTAESGDYICCRMGELLETYEPGERVRFELVLKREWMAIESIIIPPAWGAKFAIEDVLVRGESIVNVETPFSGGDLDENQTVRDHNLGRPPRIAGGQHLFKGDSLVVIARNCSPQTSQLLLSLLARRSNHPSESDVPVEVGTASRLLRADRDHVEKP